MSTCELTFVSPDRMTRTWSLSSCSAKITRFDAKLDLDPSANSAACSASASSPQKPRRGWAGVATVHPQGRTSAESAVRTGAGSTGRQQPGRSVELLGAHPDLLEAVGRDQPEPVP